MTFNRSEIQDGAVWARRALGKDRAPATTQPGTAAQTRAPLSDRIAAWSAKCRQEDATRSAGSEPQTRTVVTGAAAYNFGRFPSSYGIGERKVAMDGSVWTRAA